MSESDAPQKKVKTSRTERRRNARSFTLQALYQWQVEGSPVNEIEAQFRVNNDMADTDIALFSELLRGISANRNELDSAFSLYIDRALDDLDPVELAVLRIGTYELMHRIDVPYRVAINESVELAKIFGATESHRYINGVLDKLAQKVRAAEVMARR
ncbi:transcription antitermination factor NusB [Nitrincola sp. MINF-07-Sa-05]|uniref:transcription antitermination factor NusB n=1 Tax=Nitrincola salilacus TaxID=3400273 RepID=UPI0039184F50